MLCPREVLFFLYLRLRASPVAMPLCSVKTISPAQRVGLWHLTETHEHLRELYEHCSWDTPAAEQPAEHVHPRRKSEFYAQHLLLRLLAARMGCSFSGLRKNKAGKPSAVHARYHLSVAHDEKYLVACIHLTKRVGIDVEAAHRPFRRLRTKYLQAQEITACQEDPTRYGLYWVLKEACYKWWEKGGLSLKRDLCVLGCAQETWRVRLLGSPAVCLRLRSFSVADHLVACSV